MSTRRRTHQSGPLGELFDHGIHGDRLLCDVQTLTNSSKELMLAILCLRSSFSQQL